MAYYIYTRNTETSETWDPVIDINQSWKKAVVVKKIFMSESEARDFIDEKASLDLAECFSYRNKNLHKIVEIE
jgi:hypothetical protein